MRINEQKRNYLFSKKISTLNSKDQLYISKKFNSVYNNVMVPKLKISHLKSKQNSLFSLSSPYIEQKYYSGGNLPNKYNNLYKNTEENHFSQTKKSFNNRILSNLPMSNKFKCKKFNPNLTMSYNLLNNKKSITERSTYSHSKTNSNLNNNINNTKLRNNSISSSSSSTNKAKQIFKNAFLDDKHNNISIYHKNTFYPTFKKNENFEKKLRHVKTISLKLDIKQNNIYDEIPGKIMKKFEYDLLNLYKTNSGKKKVNMNLIEKKNKKLENKIKTSKISAKYCKQLSKIFDNSHIVNLKKGKITNNFDYKNTNKNFKSIKFIDILNENIIRKLLLVNGKNEEILSKNVINLLLEESKSLDKFIDEKLESFCFLKDFDFYLDSSGKFDKTKIFRSLNQILSSNQNIKDSQKEIENIKSIKIDKNNKTFVINKNLIKSYDREKYNNYNCRLNTDITSDISIETSNSYDDDSDFNENNIINTFIRERRLKRRCISSYNIHCNLILEIVTIPNKINSYDNIFKRKGFFKQYIKFKKKISLSKLKNLKEKRRKKMSVLMNSQLNEGSNNNNLLEEENYNCKFMDNLYLKMVNKKKHKKVQTNISGNNSINNIKKFQNINKNDIIHKKNNSLYSGTDYNEIKEIIFNDNYIIKAKGNNEKKYEINKMNEKSQKEINFQENINKNILESINNVSKKNNNDENNANENNDDEVKFDNYLDFIMNFNITSEEKSKLLKQKNLEQRIEKNDNENKQEFIRKRNSKNLTYIPQNPIKNLINANLRNKKKQTIIMPNDKYLNKLDLKTNNINEQVNQPKNENLITNKNNKNWNIYKIINNYNKNKDITYRKNFIKTDKSNEKENENVNKTNNKTKKSNISSKKLREKSEKKNLKIKEGEGEDMIEKNKIINNYSFKNPFYFPYLNNSKDYPGYQNSNQNYFLKSNINNKRLSSSLNPCDKKLTDDELSPRKTKSINKSKGFKFRNSLFLLEDISPDIEQKKITIEMNENDDKENQTLKKFISKIEKLKKMSADDYINYLEQNFSKGEERQKEETFLNEEKINNFLDNMRKNILIDKNKQRDFLRDGYTVDYVETIGNSVGNLLK